MDYRISFLNVHTIPEISQTQSVVTRDPNSFYTHDVRCTVYGVLTFADMNPALILIVNSKSTFAGFLSGTVIMSDVSL